ncbi:LysE family transporter [Streptomyces sp. NPDC048560]|uniref:LysE family transporter n=1 Tax=Streptomyces sp. NPDC048560 TaxID=3155488 RepID=UPI0034213731
MISRSGPAGLRRAGAGLPRRHRAAARRRSLGRAAAFGAQAGLCVHIAAAVVDLSLFTSRSALAHTMIKLAGAAYLMYLGVRTLLASRRSGKADGARQPRGTAVPRDRAGVRTIGPRAGRGGGKPSLRGC